MTLAEIEILLKQLQQQVIANTAAITSITNALSQYATTDDLRTLSARVNTLSNNNIVLQDAIAALDTSVSKIDHLQTLLDVDVENLTENDILQYSNRGKWQNVQPSEIKGIVNINVPSSEITNVSLNSLSDVMLIDVKNEQVLQYDSQLGYWTNKTIKTSSGQIGNLDNYLTYDDAKRMYLPLTGGTLTGPLTIKAMLTVEDNILVHKALTMHDN